MSPVHYLLLHFSPTALFGIIVGCEVAFGLVGLLIVQHFFEPNLMKSHNDVADSLFSVVGTIYAVLIAFMVIIVWERFDKADLNAKTEANYLADIYRDAEAFSPALRQKLNPLLRVYRDDVVNLEWPAMQIGNMSQKVETDMNQIWTLYTTYRPKNATDNAFFQESITKLNVFREMRRQRLMDAREGVEPLLWFIGIMGGFIIIAFSFMFGAENKTAHLIMVVFLSAMIGITLYTIMELDYPFTGQISIPSTAFQNTILN